MLHYREVSHAGLDRRRLVRAPDPDVADLLARRQVREWEIAYADLVEEQATSPHQAVPGEASWKDLVEAANQGSSYARKVLRERGTAEAASRTAAARHAIGRCERLLRDGVLSPPWVNWDSLRDQRLFTAPAPEIPPVRKPALLSPPREPRISEPAFRPRLGLHERLFPRRRAEAEALARGVYDAAHGRWLRAKEDADERNRREMLDFNERVDQAKRSHEELLRVWRKEREAFETQVTDHDRKLDSIRAAYTSGEPEAVEMYCDMIMANSVYPTSFPRWSDVSYQAESRTLLVDLRLPTPDHMPHTKEVRYVQTRLELVEIPLAEAGLNALYDSVVYQVVLRTIFELWDADAAGAIEAISLNGSVRAPDRATGVMQDSCIVSIVASREEFASLELEHVDPKTCFRQLKGVGSSKLHSLTAVPPVMALCREDRRFVGPHAVADQMAAGTNVAAMAWEDFEHLVRELFEAEFASNGGEVKVTQASRDGGVDAVAFDPDPIRGGKIVIQAKRYTNTVGVGAVRDLYGTLINEGANKGILITTANYGPDAYEFARGKPITLLNGGHLLHLLARHGRQARIDLQEARAEQRSGAGPAG